MTVLRLRGLRRTHRGSGAVFELDVPALDLDPGAAFAATGPSGSGKSTLLDLLALASKPDRVAEFRFGGADVAALWAKDDLGGLARLRGAGIGYVLQTGGLLPFLTVGDNIALPQRLVGRRDPERIAMLARRLGIASELGKLPAQLSVGQRQRAAIARALSHRPSLVLADEPTAAIHPSLAEEIFALLIEEARAAEAALVVATHDAGLVERFGLRRVVCAPGRGDGGATLSSFALAA